jgi:hypothetical protein
VKLINTDGLAFIGPASEWFWTAVSGGRARGDVHCDLPAAPAPGKCRRGRAGGRAPARLAFGAVGPESRCRPASVPPGAATAIGSFWERVGYLVRAGHVDSRVIDEVFSGVGVWWTLIAPMTSAERIAQGDPRLGEHFEWLAGTLDEMARRSGATTMDDSRRTSWKERQILANVETIRAGKELRAVIVCPLSTASLEPETAATSSPA